MKKQNKENHLNYWMNYSNGLCYAQTWKPNAQ